MAKLGTLASVGAVWVAGGLGLRRRQEGRPVFVLSMPRSGSSWVGRLLGAGQGVQYFREPFSRTHVASTKGETLVPVAAGALPPAYQRADRRFERGSPHFRPSVIGDVRQWPPFKSAPARVVVKEVNPLATGWFVEAYDPDLVLLVRHPADIALSFKARGWWDPDPDDPRRPWYAFGEKVARSWAAMLAGAEGARALHARYEDICLDTGAEMRRIFDFAGIQPGDEFTTLVGDLNRQDGAAEADPYALMRDSSAQVDKWRDAADPADVAALADGFATVDLPEEYRYRF